MKLWRTHQSVRKGYDVYGEMVVSAPDAATARSIHPNISKQLLGDELVRVSGDEYERHRFNGYGCWANFPDQVSAEYLGEAREGMPISIVTTSFVAG